MRKFPSSSRTQRRVARLALVTLLGLVAAACGDDGSSSSASAPTDDSTESSGASGDPIRFGILGDESGPVSAYSIASRQGAELAVAEVNEAGGIDGRSVELVTYDLVSDRANVPAGIRSLLDDGVLAIHGPTSSSALVVGAPVALQEEVALISGPSSEEFPDGTLNDFVFRNSALTGVVLEDVLSQMREESPFDRLAILHDPANNASVAEAAELQDLASAADYEVVASVTAERGTTDFSGVITQIAGGNPEAIWLSLSEPSETAAFMQQARERGIDATFIGGPPFASLQTFELAGEIGDGSLVSVPFLAATDDPEGAAFVEAYEAAYGESPDQYAALGYDAMKVLLAGREAAGSDDRVAIRDAIAKLTLEGAVGPIAFEGGSDNVDAEVVLVRVMGGTFEIVS